MFAVQIKYGLSFFQKKSKFGYIYRGEGKHFNYIVNYPTPVVIIICHPDGPCYWAVFSASETHSTGKDWKMTIPFENDLSDSKQRIERILPPIFDGLSLMDSYWRLNNIMLSSDYIAYFVDKSEVENSQVSFLRAFFDRISATKDLAYHCMGKVEIGFHGYDNDPRELYDIEEVRQYIALADSIIPELFFFSRTEEPTSTLRLFIASISEINYPLGKRPDINNKIFVEIDRKYLEEFIKRHFIGLNRMTEWLGLSIDENKDICDRVIHHIFPGAPLTVGT